MDRKSQRNIYEKLLDSSNEQLRLYNHGQSELTSTEIKHHYDMAKKTQEKLYTEYDQFEIIRTPVDLTNWTKYKNK